MKAHRKYQTPTDSFEEQLTRIEFVYQEICLYRALKAKMDKLPYLPKYLVDALEAKKQGVL